MNPVRGAKGLPYAAQPASPSRVVLLLGAGTAVSLLGDSTLYTVLPRPEIAAQAGVSLAMVGVLLGANRVVRLLTNGLAGMLYDRLPRRRVLAASLFLGAISTLIFATSRGPVPLLFSRLLWGTAWSGIWVGGNAAVLDVSTAHNRGRLSGVYQMWFFLGAGGAALFGGVLTDLLGFHRGLLIGGGLTLLAALLWLLVLPDLNPARAQAGAAGPMLPAGDDPPGEPFPWPAALFTAVPMFVTRFVFAGVITATAILWLTELVGDGLSLAGQVVPIATLTGAFVALRALFGVLGARGAGHLSDLAGRRWLVAAGVMLAGAAGVALAAGRNPPVALIGGLVAAIAAGGVQALVPAIAGDRIQATQRGRVLSVVYTLGDLGSALGPPLALGLIQWLPAASAPVATLYRLCALLLALTVVFALWRARAERQGDALRTV